MLKSPQDNRTYTAVTLSNGLRVVLVEDEKASHSAASMVVNVGHFNDPADRPGMAHFLEHTLFLGTDLCPNPSDYSDFIHQHGGRHNAWTGTEHTCYYFDVEPVHFKTALSYFSRFFIAPLFEQQSVESERETIESEYQSKLRDDARRFYQVHKETVNPSHPFSKFSVGNKQTLADRRGTSVLHELKDFYQSNYSADKMTLVVISPQPTQQLHEWVTGLFADIPLFETARRSLPPLYTREQLATQISMVPLKAVKKLVLTFALDNDPLRYLNKPESLIGHLLGYEGANSLYAILKQQGWINTLDAGGGIKGANYKDFNISMNLTDKGMSAIDEIIRGVFEFINLIKAQGLNEWRYKEKQVIYQQALEAAEDSDPIDLACHLSLNMQHYPEQHYLIGDYVMEAFDVRQYQAILDKFSPRNMRITLVNEALPTDRNASWYGTPYSVEKISEKRLSGWEFSHTTDDRLRLPPRNPFIQKQLITRQFTNESAAPELITSKPGMTLWYGQNSHFPIPKGHIYIAMDSPVVAKATEQRAISKLYVEMVYDELIETTFQAEMGGVGYELFGHARGLSLHLGGFTGRQAYLIELLYKAINTPLLPKERFSEVKQQMLRNLKNRQEVAPLTRLFNALSCMVQPANIPVEKQYQMMSQVTHDQLVAFSEYWKRQLNLEVLIYGNYLRKEAMSLSDQLQYLVFKDSQPFPAQTSGIIGLDGLGSLQYEQATQHPDSAMVVYYQSKETTPWHMAVYVLINHLISATFFNELRTNQQLGYQVGSGYMPLNNYPGIILYVQSNVASPTVILEAISDFIQSFPLVLMGLSANQWEQSKFSLIHQILQKETSLQTCSKRYWVSIGHQDYQFQQRQQIADALISMKKSDLLKFFVQNIRSINADRLILFSHGSAHRHLEPLEYCQSLFEPDALHQIGLLKQRMPHPTMANAL